MKCVNHPEVDAEALCVICNAPVCRQCRITLNDRNYCQACLAEKVGSLNYGISKNVSTFWAFVLSLIPGAGYMYLGLMNRGLQTMLIFFGTIFVAAMTNIDQLLPLVLPVVLFYNIFDTLQLTRRIREGVPVEDQPLLDTVEHAKWQHYLGYALVGLGVLALLNNLLPYIFNYGIMHRLVTPLLIIAIGIFILYKNLERGKHNDS
ncbi:hypothetical protein [Desulfoscipio gibsoniae]|uniref:B box-type domain-containing protein n=1 Tax=Desulfoscipio gibsoniae DSM 7213 TaxID=767817 RepID=R4KJ67_9FIRM|nr:hypothetical protein [Desulfoscipio gibsoniae]AGL02664.1 hypothetical protein Desgi_3318 [Desulfoscipio gibsoniae DSM 7213]